MKTQKVESLAKTIHKITCKDENPSDLRLERASLCGWHYIGKGEFTKTFVLNGFAREAVGWWEHDRFVWEWLDE